MLRASTSSSLLPSFLGDFVFLGHRLADHPMVTVTVQWEWFALDAWVRYSRLRPGDKGVPVLEHGMDGSLLLHVPLLDGQNLLGSLQILVRAPARPFATGDVGLALLLGDLVVCLAPAPGGGRYEGVEAWRSLGRAMAGVRSTLRLTQIEVGERAGVGRIALSRWEKGAQPPSPGPLRNWCAALGLLSSAQGAIAHVVDVTPGFLRILREDPSRLRSMSPSRFEQFVAERLDRAGYRVTLTGEAFRKDGGIDLIAVPKRPSVGAFLLAGQVKHHSADQKTGREAVDRLLAWKGSCFHMGLLVTNTNFTRDAKWLAMLDSNRWFVRLRDFEDLKKWLEDNFWSEEHWCQIPDQIELAPGIKIRVPKPEVKNPQKIWPCTESDLEGITWP